MRLFLALDLPAAALQALADLEQDLRRKTEGWRWVRPEGIHLTIRFLGEVTAEQEAASRQGWLEAAAGVGPISFRLAGLGHFPQRGKPRVLFVEIVESESRGRLAGLAERVERAARVAGFTAERRPFRPHLTLARAGRGKPPARLPAGLHADYQDPISCAELRLIQSHLGPAGARYNVLSSFPLTEESKK